ncbi:MAG: cytochrome c3 family protein [Methanophagales archaeon]|nr:cytochrome c3 family protein [Methanophagales archaeon]
MKHFSIVVVLAAVVAVFFFAVAIGAISAQVMPGSAHSKVSCTDCHGSAPFAEINVSSIETCKKCHPKEVEETMSSKHAGLGATRPDTMPNTCLVCHNPHQGVYKDGKWEDQTVAEYNKFAFKGKDILGTEHTWRTFSSMNKFCLDCHGRGSHGANVSDPSKVTGKEGAWFQQGWYGNDRPIPKIEGLGDERGALPMDDPDFVSYNVWKMEKNHYGAGNAPYGSANYTEGIEDCSHKCHYGGSLIVMGGKKVPPAGYECSDCHPKTKDTVLKIETGSHASYLTQDCTVCHKPHTFMMAAPAATPTPTATPTATPTPPGFEVLFAVAGVGVATVIYMKRRR